MRILPTIMATLATLTLPAAAQACSVFIPADQRLERAQADGTVQGVAIVRIKDAAHLHEPEADTHPWLAKADVIEIIGARSNPDLTYPETVEFQRGWGSAACEWAVPPLPKTGDLWTVYFFANRDGELQPWLALSSSEAEQFDRTLMAERR